MRFWGGGFRGRSGWRTPCGRHRVRKGSETSFVPFVADGVSEAPFAGVRFTFCSFTNYSSRVFRGALWFDHVQLEFGPMKLAIEQEV